MTSDPLILEQTYHYFLQEAPELLQTLEQGLLSLKAGGGTLNQVNDLLRASHTLKGAATSVDLKTIATVAHSLEDIFRALCKPDVSITDEVEALLFEGFECLRIPLTAILTGSTIEHGEILDRAASVFALLHAELGDCFENQAPLPTSADLGFDITQSIFETGVEQRLTELAKALESASPREIAEMLRGQKEVFWGLAESLGLPGFGAIAQVMVFALDKHPDRVLEIARIALEDLRQAQATVLAGDRTMGGEPSQALQELADLDNQTVDGMSAIVEESLNLPLNQPELSSDIRLDNIWLGHIPVIDTPYTDHSAQATDPITDPIYQTTHVTSGNDISNNNITANESNPNHILTNPIIIEPPDSIKSTSSATDVSYFGNKVAPSNPAPGLTPSPAKESAFPNPHIRVNVKYLDQLNYSIGELLTNQNRQSLQTEQIQTTIQTLQTHLKRHQQFLNQLRDSHNPTHLSSKSRLGDSKPKHTTHNHQSSLVQSLIDNISQLTETVEAVEFLTSQSHQTLEQQRQLLSGSRDALIEARMQPLAEIFSRFPRLLQQLETLYNKKVALAIHGGNVLVDKVVAEKLYAPLLHLLRNAFDHGIEAAETRREMGKQEQGLIEIGAHNQGRYLVIEVRDDGKGVDFEKIRQRAVEKQLISPAEADMLNQAQLIDLLFIPGFSTAAQVNDLSGRGVGLDVVQAQLQTLQGSAEVNSMPYEGTVFTLKIPLSLSIAQLLICEAGSRSYALLNNVIEHIIIPQSSQIQERGNGKFLRWNKGGKEQLVPVYSLMSILNYGSIAAQGRPIQGRSALPNREKVKPLILIRCHESFVGLEVDQLVGEQELVIRPLGKMIEAVNYVHGASVLADGRLTLVIDGATLVETVLEKQQNQAVRSSWSAPAGSCNAPPMAPQPVLTQAPPVATPPALPIPTKSHTQILVVEDSITTRQTLVLTLQRASYQVFQATNGQEGVEQLERQTDIQLVICDIEMPQMNGFEFLRHCQRIPKLADIPVVILSSLSDDKHRLLASQLGATAYMTKPFMPPKLLAVVANLLERRMVNSGTELGV
jgi:chemotaxis protein histidine kinase CheA/ActR/RegA family two-component response regulator